ncbi:hypothetical protein LzC2_33430 [Planctomycetes bacterium LzC2]|uniref:Uncharacterized protein n=2 Tax=Alienimonas chondri TaxID=2681879 RepID=A0ABX1VJ30_9PLAN|nr:hypothetical protein [Alienimonas chondri]
MRGAGDAPPAPRIATVTVETVPAGAEAWLIPVDEYGDPQPDKRIDAEGRTPVSMSAPVGWYILGAQVTDLSTGRPIEKWHETEVALGYKPPRPGEDDEALPLEPLELFGSVDLFDGEPGELVVVETQTVTVLRFGKTADAPQATYEVPQFYAADSPLRAQTEEIPYIVGDSYTAALRRLRSRGLRPPSLAEAEAIRASGVVTDGGLSLWTSSQQPLLRGGAHAQAAGLSLYSHSRMMIVSGDKRPIALLSAAKSESIGILGVRSKKPRKVPEDFPRLIAPQP